MNESKNIIKYALIIALFAEAFLVYLIYFNPIKLYPIMEANTHMLVNGSLNLLSFIFLMSAFIAIKLKKVSSHKILIHFAMAASFVFLVSYILYHASIGHTIFTNDEMRPLYLTILITHLGMSFFTLPLVFITYALGFFDQLQTHRKIAKITFCSWSYVSISGIAVVIMLQLFM